MTQAIETIMRTGPVIPVLVVHDVAQAVPLATALVRGGIRVLEVTLRTPAAFDVIRAMRQVEGAIVGAGTVLNDAQAAEAAHAGAEFIVSPGLTERLAEAVLGRGIPFLPGVSTASDLVRGFELGLSRFKFFPAESSGGIPALKALSAPFGEARFCPTGGIGEASAPAWLALDSVLCVGGSWLANGSPEEVERKAYVASLLGGE